MLRSLLNTLHPDRFHGHGRRPPFFEGWYFKLVSADETQRYAVIPGVFLGEDGHAFIQVLNGLTGASAYHQFPLESFWASEQEFEVRIGPNRFRKEWIFLQIDDELGRLSGELHFKNLSPWPVSWFSPGIMGPYAWAPFMETYHGVVSLDHLILGSLTVDGQVINFNEGRGYTEKDWGQAFPKGYIWFQTNHFQTPGTCLTASVAVIPWLRSAFRGFIIGLWHNGRLYRLATYTGARIERLEVGEKHVDWVVSSPQYRLEMHALRAEAGLLRGPDRQTMGVRVNETLNGSVEVRFVTADGREILSGRGRHAGLEAVGDLDRLIRME